MAKKKEFSYSDLILYLNERYTVRQFATEAKVSTQHAYNILDSRTRLSERVIEELGIKVTYEVSK